MRLAPTYLAPLLSIAVFCSAAVAADMPKEVVGAIVTARAGADALLLWDATPRLISLIKSGTSNEQIFDTVESEAIVVARERESSLPKTTKSITVRVIYHRTGEVSPVYGAPTFAGIEKLVTVTVPYPELSSHANAWYASLAAGQTPADVKVDVTGKLPPR